MSFIIGLTGQSGAGKTTVCKYLAQAGFGIINCDEVARICMLDGSDCCRELAKHFPSCFDKKLSLDRRAISRIIFSDREKLKLFDGIVYPFINKLIDESISKLSDKYEYIVLDAPTLFEAGADKKCDIIIGVTADKNTRLKRIMQRDGIDEELALKRFASQHTTRFYKNRCDMLIVNDGTALQAENSTKEIIKRIKESKNGSN